MNVANLLRAGTAVLWVAVVGLIILAVLRASRGVKVGRISTVILVLAIVAVVLTSISAGLVFLQPEERGVVISAVAPKGYREEALTPGLHWIIPFFENVVNYPIKKQTYTMSRTAGEGQVQGDDAITARTFDGQEIFVDASVIYEIDPEKVVDVHIQWQNRYQDDLVRAQSRGITRDAVSQFNVEEVVSTKRFELAKEIHDNLAQKLSDNGLILIDYILRNITFTPEYAASVEQKQIADQQAQQAKFVVEQRKQEAEQARQVAQGQADAVVINAKGLADARVIQAQAEAQALDLIARALQGNTDLLTYTYINKIAPGVQVMLVPNNTPFLLPLPTIGPPAQSTTEASPTPAPTPLPLPTALPTPAPTATP
jgi:regulator of protease activity HflC (stomatin/prohibitin superfamily)